ncbi:uncharacterized protein LY89DRAFT_788658 [Mollisia scopiformis]|uniref:Uncharacterized protein n=1 Tax=Mollisia scopiformis TaxID=149040 RepID=A0A132B8K9_MOLSC|nr:uncharacterized protein LY89DRAFT_788658 [Mollisia scopiformis]KUJ08742.1 hypothetical protein LY89DRAFT_788658 [Mollisia scopiformis]
MDLPDTTEEDRKDESLRAALEGAAATARAKIEQVVPSQMEHAQPTNMPGSQAFGLQVAGPAQLQPNLSNRMAHVYGNAVGFNLPGTAHGQGLSPNQVGYFQNGNTNYQVNNGLATPPQFPQHVSPAEFSGSVLPPTFNGATYHFAARPTQNVPAYPGHLQNFNQPANLQANGAANQFPAPLQHNAPGPAGYFSVQFGGPYFHFKQPLVYLIGSISTRTNSAYLAMTRWSDCDRARKREFPHHITHAICVSRYPMTSKEIGSSNILPLWVKIDQDEPDWEKWKRQLNDIVNFAQGAIEQNGTLLIYDRRCKVEAPAVTMALLMIFYRVRLEVAKRFVEVQNPEIKLTDALWQHLLDWDHQQPFGPVIPGQFQNDQAKFLQAQQNESIVAQWGHAPAPIVRNPWYAALLPGQPNASIPPQWGHAPVPMVQNPSNAALLPGQQNANFPPQLGHAPVPTVPILSNAAENLIASAGQSERPYKSLYARPVPAPAPLDQQVSAPLDVPEDVGHPEPQEPAQDEKTSPELSNGSISGLEMGTEWQNNEDYEDFSTLS